MALRIYVFQLCQCIGGYGATSRAGLGSGELPLAVHTHVLSNAVAIVAITAIEDFKKNFLHAARVSEALTSQPCRCA